MANNPPNGFDPDAIRDALVELTAPDGTVYRFRFGAALPYEGQEYVVLVELEPDANGEEQLLITRLSDAPEGGLSFEVVTEDDVIQKILEMYEEQLSEETMEDACCCGHDHGDGCGCGDEACGCGDEACGCGDEACGCGDCGCSH